MATDKPRFTITLDPNTLEQVLDYKGKNNFATQSKAIQKLIEIGIMDVVQSITPPPSFTPDEQHLISLYRRADDRDRETVWNILGRYDEESAEDRSSVS